MAVFEMNGSSGGGSATELINMSDWKVACTAQTGSTTLTFQLEPNLKNKIYIFQSSNSETFSSYSVGDNATAIFSNKASQAIMFIDNDGNSYYQSTSGYWQPYDGYVKPTYNKTTGAVTCTQRGNAYYTIVAEVM